MSTLETLFGAAAIDRSAALLMDVTLKATMLLVAAMLVSLAMRKKSAAARHRLWALTMLSLLVLPLLPSMIPTLWSVTVPRQVATLMSSETAAERRTQESAMPYFPATNESLDRPLDGTPIARPRDSANVFYSETPVVAEVSANEIRNDTKLTGAANPWDFVRTFMPLVWLCGVAFCLANIAIGTWRVLRFRAASCVMNNSEWDIVVAETKRRLGLTQSVPLREHPEPVVPMTLGALRPIVVLPYQAREWPEPLKRIVLLHELAHVKRRDVGFQWLGRLACSMYWFHPLAWFGLQQLRKERELACDDLVVHCGERATEYAEALVSVAKTFQTQRGLTCAVAMARPGNLEGRMRSLFDKDIVRSHKPLSRIAAIAMLVVSALAVNAVSAMQVIAEPPEIGKFPVVVTPGAEPVRPRPKQSERSLLGTITKGISELVVANSDQRAAGPLERVVKVVAESGIPVENAKIIPWGVGTTNGTGWGWRDGWPKEFVTNDEGIATVLVPEEFTAIIPAKSGDFTFISFRVEHSDFAPEVRVIFRGDAKQPITLSKGVTVTVKAIHSQTRQQMMSDLYAVSSGFPNLKWQVEAGLLRSPRFNPTTADTGRYFRVVYAPNEGLGTPMMFSDVIDASLLAAEDHIASPVVELHPGIELSGSLSETVERPVKDGGHITATILSSPDNHGSSWHDVVPIAEDGTFKFAALPRDSHVELIAVCDGWVSRCTVETAAAYDRIYGTEFAQLHNKGTVVATPFRLDSEASNILVNMEETGICKFKVIDEHEDPIDLATIMLYPNQRTRQGSTYLGAGGRSIDALRNPDSVQAEFAVAARYEHLGKSYTRVTNSSGIAVISNLPNGSESVRVDFPGHELVPDPKFADRGDAMEAEVDINAGELSQKILHMRKADKELSRSNIVPIADGAQQIMLRIVDPDGVPLPKAKITLVNQSITTLGKKQPWPADWPADVSLQGMATAAIRIPRMANVTAEDLAKASIWIDIEADGCVPLKNHEVSLSQRLPIRLQAADQKPE